jgi:sugar lactone lactonase YvrE
VSKERSTLQPFTPGDVFVGSTVLDGAADDHAGRGRILQFDSHLRKKGVLWLEHTTHLVGGLEFDRDGRLWAFDSQAFVVVTIARDGRVQRRDFGLRPFSNVNFASDGTLYLAEHVCGSTIKAEIQARMGTRLVKMPGSDRFGDGHVWQFAADGTLLRELATQVHGGIGGFMGVTMSALSPDESTLVYCSETGARLMRYDVENARQLPDLQCVPEGEREMFFAMDYGPHGRLYVSRGHRIDLVSPSGRTMVSYPLEGNGWVTVKASCDGRHLYVGNFFTGKVVKMAVDSGEWVAVGDTGVERSLAGIAEYPFEPSVPRRKVRSRHRKRKVRARKRSVRAKGRKMRSPKRKVRVMKRKVRARKRKGRVRKRNVRVRPRTMRAPRRKAKARKPIARKSRRAGRSRPKKRRR